ncbi:MAG: hypothetical protein QOI05_3054 [Bradyrhizobium sp.]|nr:hypothetical protein [Bradyrhizobium sp.]
MFRKGLSVILTTAAVGLAFGAADVLAADRSVDVTVVKRSVKRLARHMLPAGLPRAHYSYRTTIISGPPIPYDARPFAYGRYPYAPYTNSYGIPAAVIVDPVDPAVLWRPLPYDSVYATPYSCFYYGSC